MRHLWKSSVQVRESNENLVLNQNSFRTTLGIALLATSSGCWSNSSPPPLKEGVSEYPSVQMPFQDIASESGINFCMNFLPYEQGQTFKINLYDHGCGLAAGDFDGDGDDDLYFLNQLGANGLYRNLGNCVFEDVTEEMGVGLEDRISVGATFADYDNDGDQDLFVTSTRGGNVLFRNDENNAFIDCTAEAGLAHVGHSQTPTFFDYDNDGLLDLFIVQTAAWTHNEFDESSRYYLGKGETGFAAVIAAPIEHNILYHNEGNGTFKNVTESAGMQGRGWAGDVATFDFDEDGWQDVLVTSMFGRAQLYRNNAGTTFTDVTLDTLGKTPFGGIGARVFDFNNDGKLDIYIVDMHSDMWMGLDRDHHSYRQALEFEKERFLAVYGPYASTAEYRSREQELQDMLEFSYDEVLFGNAFFKNLGGGKFEEISQQNDLESFWPWGIAVGDFDNDRFADVFLAAGMGYPFYYWPNSLLMNRGNERFFDRASENGIEPPRDGRFLDETILGQECARSSRCAVTSDFDGDGRLELVVNNFNHEPYFYKNQFPTKNYVAFRLQGSRSNRDAIGALVRLTLGDETLVRQVDAASGYLSHSSKTLHFGLGDAVTLDRIEIRWPSGTVQALAAVEVNQLHEVVEPEVGDSLH